MKGCFCFIKPSNPMNLVDAFNCFVHVSEYGDVNALPKNKNKSLVDLIGGNYK